MFSDILHGLDQEGQLLVSGEVYAMMTQDQFLSRVQKFSSSETGWHLTKAKEPNLLYRLFTAGGVGGREQIGSCLLQGH